MLFALFPRKIDAKEKLFRKVIVLINIKHIKK